MRSDEARELLGAWAVDALDDVERRAVERAIDDDPELAREAARLRRAVGDYVSDAAVEPPADLRERVLRAVAALPAAGARPRPGRRRLPWLAAAAAALLLVAIPSVLAWQADRRADQATADLVELVERLSEPGTQVVQAEVADGGVAAVLLGDDGAMFVASGLSRLDGQDYQLWVIDADGPVSAGLLTVTDGTAVVDVGRLDAGVAVAMTVEPPGGSSAPTTDPIVVLQT